LAKVKEKTYTFDEALNTIFGNKYIVDTYQNMALNMGYGTRSPLESTQYQANNNLTWDMMRIQQMERDQPILRRIVKFKSSAMLKGIDISSLEMTNEEIKEVQQGLQKVYRSMYDFIYQGWFYGGSAGLLVFKGDFDNEETLLKPLRANEIKKDTFMGIKPLERWFGITPTGILLDELSDRSGIYDPRLLGEPLYFDIRFGGKRSKKYRVHRSRLLLFNTGYLPFIQKQIEQYWGVSLVELLYEPLNRYNTAINAVINMFIIANTRVMKIDEVTDSGIMTDRAVESLKNKFKLMSAGLNFSNILFIGSDDEFKYESVNLTNISETLKSIRLDLCSSAEVPISQVFDEGNIDVQNTENSYKAINETRDVYMYEYYETLINIIYRNLYGKDTPSFSITFNKIRDISEKDVADIINKTTMSLLEVYKSGAMNTETFIRSLTEITDNISDVYNNFTQDFIKSNGERTYTDRQIEVARALNKGADSVGREKLGGEEQEKKPTPRVKVEE
jgi:uncharacterized protein